MARPRTISDEDLIEAAREVFLERGAHGTTAEVAAKAGVSEGTIFKRFGSKEKLFGAACKVMPVESVAWVAALPGRVGRGQVQQQIEEVVLEAVGFFRLIFPLIVAAHAAPFPAREQGEAPPLRVIRHLTAWMEAEMKLGRVRKHDPEVVARMILGATFTFASHEVLFKSQETLPMAAETYARGIASVLWQGLAPETTKR